MVFGWWASPRRVTCVWEGGQGDNVLGVLWKFDRTFPPLLASLLFLFLFFSCLLAILDQWHATLPSARVPCIIMIGKEFSGSEIVLDDPIDQIPSVWESEREE